MRQYFVRTSKQKVLSVLCSEMMFALCTCESWLRLTNGTRCSLHLIPSLIPSLAKTSAEPAWAQLSRNQAEAQHETEKNQWIYKIVCLLILQKPFPLSCLLPEGLEVSRAQERY